MEKEGQRDSNLARILGIACQGVTWVEGIG
jgi:hypothetical protein